MAVKNWKKLAKESSLIVALAVLCQDYVIADEEFMNNTKLQKNIDNQDFWIDLSHSLKAAIGEHMNGSADNEFDAFEDTSIDEKVMFNYIMNIDNRFEINDVICQTIDEYLTHMSGKRK